MMNMLLRTALGTALFLCQAATAGPVELSGDHQGQALIVPVWTVEAGNDTLISVRNNSELAVAVKVRLIDAVGAEMLAFNLYLNDDDTWTGALTASDTGTALLTRDDSCTLSAQEMPDADLGIVLRPPGPRDGYLELIEMARLPQVFLGASVITRWPDCDELAERFETGEWATDPGAGLIPPGRDQGRISASAQIIDVADGGMITVPVTALNGFTDIVQHTPPDSPVPNLSTAHGEGTQFGATESRVCTAAGCSVLAWQEPVEAVASVLVTTALRGDVALNPAIGGLTELVVTRPLKRYESPDGTGFAIESEPGFALFDREGAFVESQVQTVQLTPPPPPKATPVGVPGLETGDSVVAVSFKRPDSGGDAFGSPILGVEGSAFSLDGTGFIAGHARIVFRQRTDQKLVPIEGDPLAGEAAIGIAVQQVTNGTLEPDPDSGSTVLSNYRTAEPMTRRWR